MKSRTSAVFLPLLVSFLMLPACARSNAPTPPDPIQARQIPEALQGDLGPVVAGNTAFALSLYDRIRSRDGNLILSPYSISTAFAMTWAGARGQTEEEIARTLDFPSGQDDLHRVFGALKQSLQTGSDLGGYRLDVANRLWGQEGVHWLQPFLDVTRTDYGAELEPLNFRQSPEQSRSVINRWVSEHTEGKIAELFPQGSITSSTSLVLSNAIYFKGRWQSRFNRRDTRTGRFHVSPSRTVDVPFMHQEGEFGFGGNQDLSVLVLPYEGRDLSMVLLLPASRGGLGALEARLSPETLAAWSALVRSTRVTVSLPRFHTTSSFSLGQNLSAMGMPSAFAPGEADFSGMDGARDLYVSAVLHQAYIEVNEEGTEAAAATGIGIGITSAGPIFQADHPFLYLIRDEVTGSILFLGRVADPS